MNCFVCLFVCMSVYMYVGLSHFFETLIIYNFHFHFILQIYLWNIKSFKWISKNLLFKYFFQKSSLFIYKFWVFTISFYICQIKKKSFLLNNTNFLSHNLFQKLSVFQFKSWFPTICHDIHFTGILLVSFFSKVIFIPI